VARNPVTRMLIRLNSIMRSLRERAKYPILYVVDRMGDSHDAVVIIVDIFYEDRESAEGVAKEILDLLGSHNVKVVDHRLDTIVVPHKEVWRFVAKVAVDSPQ